MEAKLKALREVEQIYRLSKKWTRNMPDEKRPNFERMADTVFRKAMESDARGATMPVNVRAGRHMHEHDERSARLIERTLKTGEYGPDALHSFQSGRVLQSKRRQHYRKPTRQAGDVRVRHVVQHPAVDIQYPHGHLQGAGFVPSMHETPPLRSLKPAPGQAAPAELPKTDSIKTSYQ